MEELILAKRRLQQGGHTLVLKKGDTVHVSDLTGVAPMMAWLSEGLPMTGFSAADKIVGKAAAMLFVLAGIKEVYGEVMSKSGLDTLKAFGIPASYGTLTERIINRQGTGLCPMETAVLELDDPRAAFEAIRTTLAALRVKNG